MYIYIYVCVCKYVCVYILYMNIYIYVYIIYAFIYVNEYAYRHIDIYMYRYVYTCIHMCTPPVVQGAQEHTFCLREIIYFAHALPSVLCVPPIGPARLGDDARAARLA